MGDGQLPAMPWSQLVQDVQQNHRVEPARDGDQNPLPTHEKPAGADVLLNVGGQFAHIRMLLQPAGEARSIEAPAQQSLPTRHHHLVVSGVHKKAARSPNRAAPTLTSHYETQDTALLKAAIPRQSMKHCTNETHQGIISFKIS